MFYATVHLFVEATCLKDQCVRFRGIYWQKWNIIFMFSLVYNHLKNKNHCVFVTLE